MPVTSLRPAHGFRSWAGPWVLGRSSGGVTDRGSKNGKQGRSGAVVLVHAS